MKLLLWLATKMNIMQDEIHGKRDIDNGNLYKCWNGFCHCVTFSQFCFSLWKKL